MVHYRVKLNENHGAKPSQVKDGYLAFDENHGHLNGVIAIYPRGEAIRKALMFGGKIERSPMSIILNPMKLVQIPERAIIHEVHQFMKPHIQFRDVLDNDEEIYSGGIFMELLSQSEIFTDKARIHLGELAQMFNDVEYIMLTK